MKKQSSSLIKLVKMLNNSHNHERCYQDGTSLGDKLNITRSAVWKQIKKLEGYDIQIDSIKGKGYALAEPLILLQQQQIKRGLENKEIKVEVFESIGSTNDYLKETSNIVDIANVKSISNTAEVINPVICIAEQQSKGRGRFNRYWHSPFAQNIYLSCLYPFQKDISELTGLGFAVSLAIVKTLNSYKLPQPLAIKWPNDIMYQGKKLASSLIELQGENHGCCKTIIGLSVNTNLQQDKINKITQAWTSLRNITGDYIDRNELCIAIVNTLMEYITRFEKTGLTSFLKEWGTLDYLLNKKITLQSFSKKTTGIVKGINAHGHLLLELSNGKIQAFLSGDTTILKK